MTPGEQAGEERQKYVCCLFTECVYVFELERESVWWEERG